jgi:hypothetical protein
LVELHRALYCALITVLSGKAEIGAYPEWLQVKWIEYFEKSRTDPDVKPPEKDFVAPFTELFSRAENVSPPLLQLTLDQRADILKLNEFRGDLEHVKPRTWSLEIGGLPRMSMVAADAFEMLLPSFSHRLDETKQAEAAISKLKEFGLQYPTSAPQSWRR